MKNVATELKHPAPGSEYTDKAERHSNIVPIGASRPKSGCSRCQLREHCLPAGLGASELPQIEAIVVTKLRVRCGDYLYRSGDRFASLYAVRKGFFRSQIPTESGKDPVTGFRMCGEILGMDGIGNDVYSCDTIALEDSEVCRVRFSDLERVSRNARAVQRRVYQLLSQEIARDQSLIKLIGTMTAASRLAAFLLDLSRRAARVGHSPTELRLPMTRREIGLHLALQLCTVSRSLSSFQADGLISIRSKQVCLLDAAGLRRHIGGASGLSVPGMGVAGEIYQEAVR